MNEEDSLLFTSLDIQEDTSSMRALDSFILLANNNPIGLSSINTTFFASRDSSWLRSSAILLVSLLVSTFAILPYTIYQRHLLVSDWILFCICRPIAYYIIFAATWHKLLSSYRNYWGTWRIVISCIFSGIYTTLYTIKWTESEGIPLRYASLTCLCMSWFVVFYEVMDRHLSSRSSLSAMDLRRKQALLYAVRQQELACWHVSGFSKFVYKSLSIHKSISALVCKHVDSNLHPNSSEEIHLTIYENCAYDSYDKPIGSLVNLAVGFSFIPLSLALVEDYGYSFFKLIGDENIFLILVFVCCVTLACLYLMSTYPIYHKMIDKLIQLVRDPREAIVSFIRRVPLYFMAGIAALNRMNASYSIFGSIAGRMDVPSGLGLTLVWFAVLVVATVDFCATLKIMSRSIKYIWMNSVRQMGDWRVGIPCLDAEIDRSVSRYYTKQLKILIRNSTEYELSCMVGYLL